jgi:hypothetical protein
MVKAPEHRYTPVYFNFGMVLAPAEFSTVWRTLPRLFSVAIFVVAKKFFVAASRNFTRRSQMRKSQR